MVRAERSHQYFTNRVPGRKITEVSWDLRICDTDLTVSFLSSFEKATYEARSRSLKSALNLTKTAYWKRPQLRRGPNGLYKTVVAMMRDH